VTARPSLLEGDVGGHVRRLALPLAWGLLAMTSFTVADTYFISQLGTKPLAALGFCIPVVMFFMGIIFGLNVGTSSIVSRVYGSGDMAKVRELSTDAISLAVVVIVIASVIGHFTTEPIFRMMGAKAELLPLIRKYMSIWYVALPFISLTMMGNAVCRAVGDTKFVSRIMTLLAVSNLVLDPLLIFGWGPFPRMELAGAAAAHVAASWFTCMVSYFFIIFRKKVIDPRKFFHAGIFRSWGRIMHVAIPSVISNQIAPISAAIITWMAAGFGKEAVAALGVAGRLESVATLIFYATGAGVSIFAGQNYGAGNYGRIQQAMVIGSRYAMVWGLFVAGLFWAFAREIPALFDKNAAVIDYTAQYLHWVPISFGAMGAMIVANAALNAMGKPLQATTLILLKAIILYVPLAYVLQKTMEFTGILAALTATNFIVGLVSYFWSRKVAS
jgi:putative MATE family efflux protein